MNTANLVVVILSVVVVALIVAVVLSFKQKGRTSGFLAAARAQALKSRVNLEMHEGKNPSLTLRVRSADRGQFEVRREGAADRLIEGLSLARPIRTADPAFSDRYHIDSDDEAFATAYFADMGKRSAVEAVFAAGFTSLAWEEGHASAVWEGFQPKDDNADFVGAASAALRALTLNVPAVAPAPLVAGGLVEKTFNSYAGIGTFVGFIAVYATVVFNGSFYGRPIDGWALFMASLRISLPLAGACVLAGLSAVRGKSWFLKAAGKLIMAAALLFPSLGFVGYELVNSLLDGGAPESFTLSVTDKYQSSGKHTSYYVYVSPWRSGQYNPRFEVGYGVYHNVVKGRTQVQLTTRPGRLGHEWIVSLGFTGL